MATNSRENSEPRISELHRMSMSAGPDSLSLFDRSFSPVEFANPYFEEPGGSEMAYSAGLGPRPTLRRERNPSYGEEV